MKIIGYLRKLGIFRFGLETGVYHDATERPLSFQDDDVFHSEKDLIGCGKQARQGVRTETEQHQGA